MKANPDEHLRVESGRSRFPFLELFLALAVIGGLVFYWFQSEEKKSGPSVVLVPAIEVPAMQPDLPTTPDIPQQPESVAVLAGCLLYTSPRPRDATLSRMPSSA